MLACRRYATIKDRKQLVLTDLPFEPGQQVEVVVLAEDLDRGARTRQLEELFRATQASHLAQSISEEDIATEIAAYREGR